MRARKPAAQGPFSRLMSVDELAALPGGRITIAADADECAALARMNELQEIKSLEADFHIVIQPIGIRLTGEVRARITQICVVSLDPFEADLRQPIEMSFEAPSARASGGAPTASHRERASGLADRPNQDSLGDDPPEPLIDGHIDLGAVASEFLTLGLDPYPRRPGAAFEPYDDEVSSKGRHGSSAAAGDNPFAALGPLRKPPPAGQE